MSISIESQQESKNIKIGDIEFIDLGVSVRWANKNIGAFNPSDKGLFINRKEDKDINLVKEFKFKGAKIPTIGQWEELKNNCHWSLTQMNGIEGYKVTGKNGNFIFIPFTGDPDTIFMKNFGRLFVRETFDKSSSYNGELYYFYFANGGNYKLTKYSLNYSCPVRLVYKP